MSIFRQGPVSLECSYCGKSLQLAQLRDGRYALGHLDVLLCGEPPQATFAVVGTAAEVVDSFLSNPVLIEPSIKPPAGYLPEEGKDARAGGT